MQSLYLVASHKNAGTLFVSLGFMEYLKRKLHRVAFFRPVIESEEKRDYDIEFMLEYFSLQIPYKDAYGCDQNHLKEMLSQQREAELFNQLLQKYKKLEAEYDFVLCEGLQRSVLEMHGSYDLNLKLAQHFGSAVVPIFDARGRSTEELENEILLEHEAIKQNQSIHFASFINRSTAQQKEELLKCDLLQEPLYFLEEQEELSLPILEDVVEALGATKILCSSQDLSRVIRSYRVAALGVENFLEHIQEGDLIVVPADRSEIILALYGALYSDAYPSVSAILFPFSMQAHPNIQKMIEGLRGYKIPIFSVEMDTFETVQKLLGVYSRLRVKGERKIALALGLFQKSVLDEQIDQKLKHLQSEVITPLMFEYKLFELARKKRKKIVLPESSDERILRAAEIILRRDVADIVLLGEVDEVQERAKRLGLELDKALCIDPHHSEWNELFAKELHSLRKQKGLQLEAAKELACDANYFATLMIHFGYADAMVSGAIHSTADTVRPALQILKTAPGVSIVSSVFFMCLETKVLVYGDCALNLDPNPSELADIAIASAKTAHSFGIEPKVAMLSYSTGESGSGADVEKVREATKLVKQREPHLLVEGPIQYDAAIDKEVAKTKMPDSQVAGEASVFIFPDLNTGNNTYKAVQRSSGALAIGPVLQGLSKPVNDLSRGCKVADIVNTIVITAIQAGDL